MSTKKYYVHKLDSSGAALSGCFAELRFAKLMLSKGYDIYKSTTELDKLEHWDYKVILKDGTSCLVDVKAFKRVKRKDSKPNPNWFCIECVNRKGFHGWLYGEANYIAFEGRNSFLMVDRKELVKLVEKKTGIPQGKFKLKNAIKDAREFDLYEIYTRSGNIDIITYITRDDILSLTYKEVDDLRNYTDVKRIKESLANADPVSAEVYKWMDDNLNVYLDGYFKREYDKLKIEEINGN